MRACVTNGRFRGQSGHSNSRASLPLLTHSKHHHFAITAKVDVRAHSLGRERCNDAISLGTAPTVASMGNYSRDLRSAEWGLIVILRGNNPQDRMSALPPKADIGTPSCDVRFVPKADIRVLFDYLVGAGEQPSRHANAERLGDLEVDKELELCRLLHRQFTRFGTLQ
jgi:hypothetical protein